MTIKPKRSRDPNQLDKVIVDLAVSEAEGTALVETAEPKLAKRGLYTKREPQISN